MGEGPTERRSPGGQPTDSAAGDSGWTTTDVAARALGVSPRSVRRFIDRGALEGRKVKEGIVETWEVSIDSLQALRDRRGPEGRVRRSIRQESVGVPSAADASPDMAELVRDLTVDLVRVSSEATEFRVRLEITERAESTLREELAQEQERRERAERRVAELEQRLGSSEAVPQASESAPEASDSPPPRSNTAGAQRGAQDPERRPSWWRRIFGG
jgi:hypothetical protein